jgi:hypothetical protein
VIDLEGFIVRLVFSRLVDQKRIGECNSYFLRENGINVQLLILCNVDEKIRFARKWRRSFWDGAGWWDLDK